MIDNPWLVALAFVVALAYSSVGLGGGSSYTALLVLFGASAGSIPTVSLLLNLVVTSVGSLNYIRHDHARSRLVLPVLASSIPMAYLGGSLALPERAFQTLLLGALVFVALRIYLWPEPSLALELGPRARVLAALLAGAGIGLLAGAAGIGGGIFLVPIVLILGLGNAKEAAASGAILIWMNSLAGLAARVQHHPVAPAELLPLAVAVLIGGTIGSQLGAAWLQPKTMQRSLGLIVVLAILLLARRLLSA